MNSLHLCVSHSSLSNLILYSQAQDYAYANVKYECVPRAFDDIIIFCSLNILRKSGRQSEQ